MRTNYICPCWSGNRRNGDDLYNKNRGIYLKVQVCQLLRLKHSLDQITIVIPHNPEETPEFRRQRDAIPTKIKDTPVVVIDTENTLSSYGPYNLVFEKYRSKFDYYMLCEDDYVPVQDEFDQILIKLIEKKPGVGYLCSRVGIQSDNTKIASVSNGIVASWAFDKIREKFGVIPHAGQSDFSNAFLEADIPMADYGGKYRAPFYGSSSAAWFNHTNNYDLIVPVQIFLEPSKFREAFLPSSWPDWRKQILPLDTFTDNDKYEKLIKGLLAI